MDIKREEAEKWYVQRLKFEIDRLRHERTRIENDLRQLEIDYDTRPEDWGGSYPSGLDVLPRHIQSKTEQIEMLEDILRNKL